MTHPLERWPHVAQRLFNAPLLIHPDKATIILAALAERLGISRVRVAGAGGVRTFEARELGIMVDGERRAAPAEYKPYAVTEGIAVIPVEGTLVHRLGMLEPYSGMTGYDGLAECLARALGDPDVRAIVLDVDSPGGEVHGCFDLVDEIHAARGLKPIWGIANETACSAAYAIISACDVVAVPRTGWVGSIGVVTMHVDFSRLLEEEGITVTLIHHGARKVDGNPFKPLPEDVAKRFQGEIDRVGELFVATVARNRGLEANDVRALEADCLAGLDPRLETSGLADLVASPAEALAALKAEISAG